MPQAQLETKRYARCPECQAGDFSVEHLFGLIYKDYDHVDAGPWFCRQCRAGITLKVYRDGRVFIEKISERFYEQFVLVEIPPWDKPVHILCEYLRRTPDQTAEIVELARFRFEENTAVSNILRECRSCTDTVPIKFLGIYDREEEGEQARFLLDFPDADPGR